VLGSGGCGRKERRIECGSGFELGDLVMGITKGEETGSEQEKNGLCIHILWSQKPLLQVSDTTLELCDF
jgi:hypothetical protein